MKLGNMKSKHVGFVSFRIAGTDGVSLEIMKWCEVLTADGWDCFFMAGELDTPPECSLLVEELHFRHPAIKDIYSQCFEKGERPLRVTNSLHHYREIIKKRLYEFVKTFNIDLLVVENVMAIPLNLPLAMALTEFLCETGIKTIGHHHDFYWERKRFLINRVWDILHSCFPPHLSNVSHVVINSSGGHQLALRTGIAATLIPNVMHFEKPAPGLDDYNADLRRGIGVADDELLILQPTRVVQRKGIEHAIELVARLGLKAKLVISHASGDEGYEYQSRVREYAELMEVTALFESYKINERRKIDSHGNKIYRLYDVYPHADLISYPSIFEGFGNAFLEAIYFRKPLLVNTYSNYSFDIRPLGFDVIEMNDFISDKTIRDTRDLLSDPERISRMVEKNYQLGLQYFSYHILKNKLQYMIESLWGRRCEGWSRYSRTADSRTAAGYYNSSPERLPGINRQRRIVCYPNRISGDKLMPADRSGP